MTSRCKGHFMWQWFRDILRSRQKRRRITANPAALAGNTQEGRVLSVRVRRRCSGRECVAYFWSVSAGLTLMNSLSHL
jgi:hypothetical protein